jgi:hypothetical protein
MQKLFNAEGAESAENAEETVQRKSIAGCPYSMLVIDMVY